MAITVLSRQAAERLVGAATAAPSADNAQPWRFVARPADRVIEIYADPARTLRRGDPRGRAVHVACGAALLNLRLAIACSGAEPVARLLPDQRNPLLLAAVRIAGPYRPRRAEQDLYAAIGLASNGSRLPGRPLARGLLPALLEAVAMEGASLRLLDQPEALRMLQALAAADGAAGPDPGRLAELHRFFAGQVPAAGRGGAMGRADGRGGRAPGRGAAAGRAPAAPEVPGGGPQLALISTRGDDRLNWLRAGQAMQRLLLLAARRGIAAAPLTPALELPQPVLRPDPQLPAGRAEILVRLGGERGTLPPRRPLAQVLRFLSQPARPARAGEAAASGDPELIRSRLGRAPAALSRRRGSGGRSSPPASAGRRRPGCRLATGRRRATAPPPARPGLTAPGHGR